MWCKQKHLHKWHFPKSSDCDAAGVIDSPLWEIVTRALKKAVQRTVYEGSSNTTITVPVILFLSGSFQRQFLLNSRGCKSVSLDDKQILEVNTCRSKPLSSMVTFKPQFSQTRPPKTSVSRFNLSKPTHRHIRTARNKLRLLISRTNPRIHSLVSILFTITAPILFILTALSIIRFTTDIRRDIFFHQPAHLFLPPPASLQIVQNRQCSWLYVEFGAKDGQHIKSFFTSASHVFEEYLRASQSPMRAFCAIAFEPDLMMRHQLYNVRKSCARHAQHMDVFTQIVPGAPDKSEEIVRFKHPKSGVIEDTPVAVKSLPLASFISNVTFEWPKSGHDVSNMNTARGNGNRGAVIVRFNQLIVREAIWYLDLLQAHDTHGVLCTRVDRLILDLQKISTTDIDQLADRDILRSWPKLIPSHPSHPIFTPTDDLSALIQAVASINENPDCRTVVHLFDYVGKMIQPPLLSNRSVLYAILAGHPTFNERVHAQSTTWMTAVPDDRVVIYTNVERSNKDLVAANGRTVRIIRPNRPELERQLSLMQSWSHLVRVRESWDHVMRHDPSIKWLSLVDDDTFVFPGGFREYLSSFDYRTLSWGGSGELPRIDNGDAEKFASWLRETHEKFGGKHCYFRTEHVPKHLVGKHTEYSINELFRGRKLIQHVSSMCHDTFCRVGCPSVPQGAAIFVSRALVKALRPFIEQCERDTVKLCKNCGSQRLYMCVNRYTNMSRTFLARGICRSPWKVEHRERFPFALTFHGFNRYKGLGRSTRSFLGDMQELWDLGERIEKEVDAGKRSSYLIPMSRIADMVACHDKGRYEKGLCVDMDGKTFTADDGKSFRAKFLNRHSSSGSRNKHGDTNDLRQKNKQHH